MAKAKKAKYSEAKKITKNLVRLGIDPSHRMINILEVHPDLAQELYNSDDGADFLRKAGLVRLGQ